MKRLALGMVIVATLSLVGCGSTATQSGSTASDTTVAQNTATTASVEDYKITNPDEALAKLKEGNERFVNDKSELKNVTSERREQLVSGQAPYAVVVTCSDSRVSPTNVFNTGLGEIFEIGIAGNVLDTDALGSIEYGAEHANAPLIVVMGHESCGAVTAEYNAVKNNEPLEGNIAKLVEKIKPSVDSSSSIEEASHKNVDSTVEQIKADPVIKTLIEEGKVKVVAAYYTLDGKVTFEE